MVSSPWISFMKSVNETVETIEVSGLLEPSTAEKNYKSYISGVLKAENEKIQSKKRADAVRAPETPTLKESESYFN